MNNFGKRLKNLRISTDITQEQLANALGISYQAVSKWENGLGLPDISLLPGISGFFGVSTDWLLGIDTEHSDKAIENVLNDVSHLKHIAKVNEGIELIEKTLKTYPNNHKLLAEWAELKVHTFKPDCEKEEWLKQIENKTNIVFRDSTDDYVRHKAKLALTFAYSFCGKREEAEKLCDTFPDEAYSRVEMYSMIALPKEMIKYKHSCIVCDLEKLLVDILSVAKHYYSFADPNKAIPVCNIALNIISLIGNEGYLISYSAEAYSDLANAYAKLNDKNKVITNIKKAFEEYLSLDRLSDSGEYCYTSPLLKGETFNRGKIEYYSPLSATQGYIQKIKMMHSYEWLKSDSDFIVLLEEMKAKAVPYKSDC